MNHFIPEIDRSFFEELRVKTLDFFGGHPLSPSLNEMLNEDLDALRTLVQPQTIYAEYAIIRNEDCILTKAGPVESRMFSLLARRYSEDCSVMFMVTTIGIEFDRLLSRITELSRQFMVDAAGTACVGMAADLLHDHLEKSPGLQGRDLSMWFSPGYCDWNLQGQRLIFNALDGSAIGVSLNDHDVMTPGKTISAAALVAKDVPMNSPCCFCERKNCPWRRLP